MNQPPTGTLTFLFTDIEGSTVRWETQREAMAGALVRHDALLRAAIEGRGGTVFKTVGDAFCAVFADAEAALSAAMDAQRALAAEAWSAFGPDFADLRVRMGIHHGKAEERAGDYFGQPSTAPRSSCRRAMAALLAAIRGDDDAGMTVALSPEQAREIAQRRPADLTEYRLGRIAEWSQPRGLPAAALGRHPERGVHRWGR